MEIYPTFPDLVVDDTCLLFSLSSSSFMLQTKLLFCLKFFLSLFDLHCTSVSKPVRHRIMYQCIYFQTDYNLKSSLLLQITRGCQELSPVRNYAS